MEQNNKNYNLEYVNCDLCGADNTHIIIKQAKELYLGYPDVFDIVCCDTCKLCYTNPRPTQDTIGYFYPETAGYYQIEEEKPFVEEKFNTFLKEKFGYNFGGKSSWFDKILYPYFTMRASNLAIPQFIPSGRLLDIGCSNGKYLLQMSALGWDTYGIEPHKKIAELARTRGAGQVHAGTIDDAPFEDGFFDVIVMNMSLEHCHAPLATVQKVEKLLCLNGVCIITVPDISGFEARIFKGKAFTIQVPQHLYHFTPKTLTALADKAGLKKISVHHHFAETDLLTPLKVTKFKWLANFLEQKFIKYFLFKPLLILLAKLHLTSRMTIFFKKK